MSRHFEVMRSELRQDCADTTNKFMEIEERMGQLKPALQPTENEKSRSQ
ncbi:hypothetical protein ACFW0H_02445 [Pseudomonas sp. CR3202]